MDLEDFKAGARRQQRHLEWLIASAGKPRRLSRLRASRAAPPAADRADPASEENGDASRTPPDLADPEFRKTLRIIVQLIGETIRIGERGSRLGRLPSRALVAGRWRVPSTGRGEAVATGEPEDVAAEESREERFPTDAPSVLFATLAERVSVPASALESLESLIGWRFELERFLVDIGDPAYLKSRALALYEEPAGNGVCWKDIYGSQPPPLLTDVIRDPDAPASDRRRASEGNGSRGAIQGAVDQTRWMIARVLGAQQGQDLPVRSRAAIKGRVLRHVWPLMSGLALLLGAIAAVGVVRGDTWPWFEIALTVVAGAMGSAVGWLRHLREAVEGGSHVREIRPWFLAHIAVGATLGLVVFLVLSSGVVAVAGGPWGRATLAFLVALFEAVSIGLVARIDARA